MNENVLPIFFKMVNKKELLSKNDIFKFLSSLLDNNGLSSYCKNIDFITNNTVVLNYNSHFRNINVNYENLINSTYDFLNDMKRVNIKLFASICNDPQIINYLFIIFLKHEYFHVIEQKKIEEYLKKYNETYTKETIINKVIPITTDKNSFNSLLLYLSALTINYTESTLYEESHDKYFNEYHAQINAYYFFIDTMNKINNLKEDEKLKLQFINYCASRFFNETYIFIIDKKEILNPKKVFYKLVLNRLNNFLDKDIDKKIKSICNRKSHRETELESILWGETISNYTYNKVRNVSWKRELTLNMFSNL